MPVWSDKLPSSEIAQLSKPHMSTLELNSILNSMISEHGSKLIFDLGCGIGAQSYFLSKNFPHVEFVGLDYNEKNVAYATNLALNEKSTNLSFEMFDVLSSSQIKARGYSEREIGLISVHTLCCFKNFEPFFDAIIRLEPRWFVVNSLFFNGPLEVLIHIRDSENPSSDDNPDSDFNIFSKELVSDYLGNHGFTVSYSDFYPHNELLRPIGGKRGSFTVSTDFHPRTQFSGPVHLPWSFMRAVKTD